MQPEEEEQGGVHPERFKNFLYESNSKPDIIVDIKIVPELPQFVGGEGIFVTYHPDNHSESWRLLKKKSYYIYKSVIKNKQQLVLVNKRFNKATVYLLPSKKEDNAWTIGDILYDFLQVLLINYFSLEKSAVFVHSIGVKDLNGKGLLFAGKSGAGKSTTARLWHKHSGAMVLNDDRIIVRKLEGKFFIYGSPWHGEFGDYLDSRIESAPLEKLFFIHHAPKNILTRLCAKEAFQQLYPVLFPVFWDKRSLENNISFCQELVDNVKCFKFGFKDNKDIIDFVRGI
jgi:hypothetical protein